MAEDDFRSVNGQIEYLLTECVRQRKKNGRYVSDQIDLRRSWILNDPAPLRGQALQKRRWYIGREDDYDSRYGTRGKHRRYGVFPLSSPSHFP